MTSRQKQGGSATGLRTILQEEGYGVCGLWPLGTAAQALLSIGRGSGHPLAQAVHWLPYVPLPLAAPMLPGSQAAPCRCLILAWGIHPVMLQCSGMNDGWEACVLTLTWGSAAFSGLWISLVAQLGSQARLCIRQYPWAATIWFD